MKNRYCAVIALMFAWSAGTLSAQEISPIRIASQAPDGLALSAMTGSGHWELRIYTINRGRLDDFVDAWLTGVYPLRLEHGFSIPAAWVSRENNQFIWLLGYDGPEAWEDKQSAYYGSSQRRSLAVDPLDMIAHGDTWTISSVNSTPAADQ